nr:copia protein [Tanacetum cinerariifolium]
MTFDESPPPTKLSPVDDDVGEEEAIENDTKVVNNNNEEYESIEVDEVVNIKESKNHPLEQVIEPKDVNEALGDESWVLAMQEELNQFVANDVWDLVPLPISQTVIGTKWVFRNKLDENGILSRNKARLVAKGYNQQEGIYYDETYALVARELNFFLGLQIKQVEDEIFSNQSKNIKEMLKKFRLEDSKPTKTPMSTEIKLTKDDKADSMDSTKYRGTKMPSEYQQDYKKTLAYAPKIYNDPNMTEQLKDIYRALESRYVHEGKTIDQSFYRDLTDESVAKFTSIVFDYLLSLNEQIRPRFIMEFFKTLT